MHEPIQDCTCEFTKDCSFFERNEGLNNTIITVQRIFCNGGKKDNCARYVVRQALGNSNVPTDLLPFDHLAADLLIEELAEMPA